MAGFFKLREYREWVNKDISSGRIRTSTATMYISALRQLNSTIINEPTSKELAETIKKCAPTSGMYYVAAIRSYERFIGREGLLLYGPDARELGRLYAPDYKGKEPKWTKEITYIKRINKANNAKVRMALTLQLRTGLRISEVLALTKEDIELYPNGHIKVHVRESKNGKPRTVNALKDPWLYKELKNFNGMPPRHWVEEELKKLHFQSHDLRRMNARTRYTMLREKGFDRYQARRVVARELGNTEQDTRIYLGSLWKNTQKRYD